MAYDVQGSSSYTSDTADMKRRAENAAGQIGERAGEAAERIGSKVRSGAQELGERSAEWLEGQREWLTRVRDYAREKPLAALGIALAVGFVLSRIGRR